MRVDRLLENDPALVDSMQQNFAFMNKTQHSESLDASATVERLIDEKELARILGVADGTPGNWRRATPPTGPAFLVVEGVVRYAPSDIRRYLELRRRDPAASEVA